MASLVDPIALEIIWRRLITIADEMTATLVRTSFSTVVGSAGDFACEILDVKGEGLAHGKRTVASFTYTMPRATQSIVREFGRESIRPGDVFMTNDPWINAGHHPDVAVITPFFYKGELGGFAGTIAHVTDMGGAIDSNQLTESYEEGIVFPPCRLYAEGRPNEDIFRIMRENVRMPDMVIGDVLAEVAANEAGAGKIVALMEEYHVADLHTLTGEIQDRSEAAMRASIGKVPDGVYESVTEFDEFDGELCIRCRITVKEDELTVDYSGSSPQQPRGGLNACLVYTQGHSAYCLKCLLLPEVPNNAGCYRPITITAPEGSVLNPSKPASVRMRTRTGWNVHQAIYTAMAQALPDAVMSGPGGLSAFTCYAKGDDGKSHHSWFFFSGGMGANSRADGRACMSYPSCIENVPIEEFEVAVPALVKQKRQLVDSGGPGRWRGGQGQTVVLEVLPGYEGECIFSEWMNRKNTPKAVPGILGGEPGKPSVIKIGGRPLTREEFLAKAGALRLRAGDTPLVFETAGAGGYGPVSERDPALIVEDLRQGRISRDSASSVYGLSETDLLQALGTYAEAESPDVEANT